MSSSDVVLVTGASSGIGRASARLLCRSGRRVFGTSRNPDRVDPVDGVTMVRLDVRDDGSVEACVAEVLDRAGRIDMLVNNAGYTLTGPAESASIEQVRSQFDTNFYGAIRMTNAVLPDMRERGSGKIAFVSSIAGFVGVPFLGVYSASKYALEGYAESLYHEVAGLGVHVSIVEPGFVRTNLPEAIVAAEHEIPAYASALERWDAAIARQVENADEPEIVALTLLVVAEADRPRLRYRVGEDAQELAERKRHMPESALVREVARRFGLGD